MQETILVVEDDAALLDALGLVLALEDYVVEQAKSLPAALRHLARSSVDLIITDSLDSRWDPTLPAIRQLQTAAPGTPLVLYTGYPPAEALDPRTLNLAAIWIKPLDLVPLLTAVRTVLDLEARGSLPDRRSPRRARGRLARNLES